MGSFGEYFLFYGLAEFYLYNSGLKAQVLLVQDSFRFLHPESWPEIRPICSRRHLSSKKFSFTLFPLTERRCHFLFRVLANHFASFFFFPVRRFQYIPSLSIRSQCKHLLAFTLTHILYFLWQASRSWPTLLFLFLAVSLWQPANSNTEGSRNSLFLFSQ